MRAGPAATVHALVTVILPAYPELDAGHRSTVEHDVTRYVARQVQAMPTVLRVPYTFALLAFEWLPLLRYGRPFRRLPSLRRASWLALWSDAPIPPMRDFVKLIRSSSLLVYFDHALVMQRLEAQRQRGRAALEPPKAANE